MDEQDLPVRGKDVWVCRLEEVDHVADPSTIDNINVLSLCGLSIPKAGNWRYVRPGQFINREKLCGRCKNAKGEGLILGFKQSPRRTKR